MDLSPYTDELRTSLAAAASVGDEATQRAAAALAATVEPAARLALMHAMSDLAAEVTRQLADSGVPTSVDVRVQGRDVIVVATSAPAPAGAPEPPAPHGADTGPDTAEGTGPDTDGHERTFAEAGGDLTRTTVRMFNELKARAEQAASEQGVSLNSFISRAVAESIKGDLPRRWKDKADRRDRDTPRGESVHGFVQG